MKKLILLFVIGFFSSCNGHNDLEIVEFSFYPSFIPPTRFTIDVNNKTIEEYTYRNTYFTQQLFDTITQKPYRRDSISTKVYYQKTFQIDGQVLSDFLKEIEQIELDSITIHSVPMLDGIGFEIAKISSNRDTVGLGSNLSSRNEESKMEYSFLDPFFDLSYKTIDDYQGLSILENIQGYFSYDLPIRKISDNPIEYRVWGWNNCGEEEDQVFSTFLRNLPNDEPIIFDFRNEKISTSCLIEMLSDNQEKDIYIYGNVEWTEWAEDEDRLTFEKVVVDEVFEMKTEMNADDEKAYKALNNSRKIKSFRTKEEIMKVIAEKK